jgi:predicted MFS family arabinose efflux permease
VRLRSVESPGDEGPAEPAKVLDGLRRVREIPLLGRVVACTALVHLLYGAALLVEPLYVRDVLGRSEQVFAGLQTLFGLTLVGGGLLVARAGERLARFSVVVAGVAGSGAAAFVYLGTPWLGVAVAGVLLWGLTTALMGGPSRTVIQRATRETEHGRVLAADLMVGSMAEVVGIATLGLVIDALGIRTSVGLLAFIVMLAAAWLARADARDPGPPPDDRLVPPPGLAGIPRA